MTVTVGFCAARSNSGKTTLLLRVLEELQRRDMKVAVLKHGRHLDGDEEKDSRRYAAQAAASLFVSPQGWTLEAHPEECCQYALQTEIYRHGLDRELPQEIGRASCRERV